MNKPNPQWKAHIPCSIGGCERVLYAKTWCFYHYKINWRHGTPTAVRKKHNLKGTLAYISWREMRRRINTPTCAAYPNYGGRGITICKEWDEYPQFLADMGERPTRKHTLERIDVNGNYEPSNCKWIPKSEQSKNRRPYSEWRVAR